MGSNSFPNGSDGSKRSAHLWCEVTYGVFGSNHQLLGDQNEGWCRCVQYQLLVSKPTEQWYFRRKVQFTGLSQYLLACIISLMASFLKEAQKHSSRNIYLTIVSTSDIFEDSCQRNSCFHVRGPCDTGLNNIF
jgi:hypothetical protein